MYVMISKCIKGFLSQHTAKDGPVLFAGHQYHSELTCNRDVIVSLQSNLDYRQIVQIIKSLDNQETVVMWQYNTLAFQGCVVQKVLNTAMPRVYIRMYIKEGGME